MNDEYNFMAKIYDPAFYFALNPIRKAVLNELYQHKDNAIIDICCGTGNQLKMLAKNGFKNLSCLDISESMLQVAKNGNSQLKIYQKDATNTEFDGEAFDIAIISFALHEKDRKTQEKMINETFRIVRKGGLILIVDYVFDEKTITIGRIGISMVERIAGKEHFKNFRNYIKHNGLISLMTPDRFKLLKEEWKLMNGVTLSTYQRL